MENDVVIKISGLQVIDESGESIETMSAGKHYIKNNKHFALYDEVAENDIKTNNIIKFNKDFMEVTRKGAVNTRLKFALNETNQSLYSTPMGDLLIEIWTKKIDLQERGNDVNLLVDYELFVDGDKVSDNNIEVEITHTAG